MLGKLGNYDGKMEDKAAGNQKFKVWKFKAINYFGVLND